MHRNRRGSLLVAVSLSIGVPACKEKSPCIVNGVSVDISAPHGHAVSIPQEHLERKVGGSYPVKGEATHEHVVTLSDAEMGKLLQNEKLALRATSVHGHTHEVSVGCKK